MDVLDSLSAAGVDTLWPLVGAAPLYFFIGGMRMPQLQG